MKHQKTTEVYDFYQSLHFNEGDDLKSDVEVIKGGALLSQQMLPSFLKALKSGSPGSRYIEAGCGIGWLSLSVKNALPQLDVIGLDYSDRAISVAANLAQQADIPLALEKCDLMEGEDIAQYGPASFLASVGVLHHCADFETAFRNCMSIVKPGGHMFIGLYHLYSRAPLLNHFKKMIEAGSDKDALKAEYNRLDARKTNMQRKESWFLDQVLHPHETKHTLAEVLEIVGNDFKHISNSITGRVLPNSAELLEIEVQKGEKAQARLEAGNYDPGFFVFHLQKENSQC